MSKEDIRDVAITIAHIVTEIAVILGLFGITVPAINESLLGTVIAAVLFLVINIGARYFNWNVTTEGKIGTDLTRQLKKDRGKAGGANGATSAEEHELYEPKEA